MWWTKGSRATKQAFPTSCRYLRTRAERRHHKHGMLVDPEKAAEVAMKSALQGLHRITTAGTRRLDRFLLDCSDNCQMAPSTIAGAGRGLFAARDIPRGHVICLYPAHMLGLEINEETTFMAFSSPADQAYFEQHDYESHLGNNLLILEGDTRPSILPRALVQREAVLHLDVNPTAPAHPSWLSHIINDGAKATSYCEKGILEYYHETNRRRNCFHVPFGPSPLMATVATRDIAEGEEFFTSYDFLYWVVDLADTSEDSKEYMVVTETMGQHADKMDEELRESFVGVDKAYYDVVVDIAKAMAEVPLGPSAGTRQTDKSGSHVVGLGMKKTR